MQLNVLMWRLHLGFSMIGVRGLTCKEKENTLKMGKEESTKTVSNIHLSIYIHRYIQTYLHTHTHIVSIIYIIDINLIYLSMAEKND